MHSILRAAGAWFLLMLPLLSLAQGKVPVDIRTSQVRMDDSTVILGFNLRIGKASNCIVYNRKQMMRCIPRSVSTAAVTH